MLAFFSFIINASSHIIFDNKMIIRYTGRDIIRKNIKPISSQLGFSIRYASTTEIPTTTGPTDPATSVRTLVEQVDRSSILASKFYPPHLQNHFLAIRAFNAEVARVAELVDNELMARIRVTWWRDAAQAAFKGKPPRHPTMIALSEAINDPNVQKYGGLVEDHFVAMCEARESDLSAPTTPPTLEEIESYAEKTSSRLFYLSLNLLGVSKTVTDQIFSHLGKARGITQLLNSVPFHAGVIRTTVPTPPETPTQEGVKPKSRSGPAKPRQRRIVLPREYLNKHGVIEEEVYRKGAEAKGLRDAVFDTATRANDYIISAKSLLQDEFKGGKVPQALIGPLVEATTSTTMLQELQKRDFDIFDTKLMMVASGKGWKLPWNMWKVGFSGKL
jgi:NADH dehydrogenase [ubiquinone] 1 alpha subcomplex assembly factor 6